jgi:pimeloyl-ACP methyl ester carboxylesterase
MHPMNRFLPLALAVGLCASAAGPALRADDGTRLLTIDHYVRVKSTVPAIAGQPAQLYVRERVTAATALRTSSLADRVVLFVHGAGTPGEVSFDAPGEGYSWMAYLAEHGYDVFAVDMTGYGRSTRPAPMNDPCNLAADRQAALVPFPALIAAPCAASYPGALTTIASDWTDVGAAVDYVTALRRVQRVDMVAWSLGGPRSGGYAAQHPDKVRRIVWLAPAYNRAAPPAAPAALPAPGAAFNTQSRADFFANWDRQVGCPDQYDPAIADGIWSAIADSDPVGATWGPGVRRAPLTTTWGWNQAVVAKMRVPALIVTGVHDKQVDPARVHELYADLGSTDKVLIDLACASHNAMWERGRTTLYRASLEWLDRGTVEGSKQGILALGQKP